MNPIFRLTALAAPMLLASPVVAHPGHGPETVARDGILHFILAPDHMLWALGLIGVAFGAVVLLNRAGGRGPRA